MGCNACAPAAPLSAGRDRAAAPAASGLAAPALAARYMGVYADAGGAAQNAYAGVGASRAYAPFRAEWYRSDFLPPSYREALRRAVPYKTKHQYMSGKADVAFRTLGDFSMRELEDELRKRKRLH